MKAPGSVDYHDVLAAIDSSIDGVEGNGCRVRPGATANEIRFRSLRPRAQLIDRSSTESIGCANQHRHPIRFENGEELPDERRLAGAVHSDHENDSWSSGGSQDRGIAVTRPQRCLYSFLQCVQELILSLNESASSLAFDF